MKIMKTVVAALVFLALAPWMFQSACNAVGRSLMNWNSRVKHVSPRGTHILCIADQAGSATDGYDTSIHLLSPGEDVDIKNRVHVVPDLQELHVVWVSDSEVHVSVEDRRIRGEEILLRDGVTIKLLAEGR